MANHLPKLGIIAGGGNLPRQLVEACEAAGRDVFVIALKGHTETDTVAGVDHEWVRLGAVGKTLNVLRAAGVRDLVLAGPVRRPSIAALRPDAAALKILAKIGAQGLGDDGLLRGVLSALEDEGFRIVAANDLLEQVFAAAGTLGRFSPDALAQSDIERGVDVLSALSAADVGQAVVVQEGLVLGVEAIEGTDQLLQRCAGLRREGPGGVLVKLRKQGQDNRVDLPTIGVETVTSAAAAGLRGIAIEANGTMILDRDAAIRMADENGLFIVAIEMTA